MVASHRQRAETPSLLDDDDSAVATQLHDEPAV